ncbi:Oidioi.mRNA.OKI2018_I69.XSR.g15686.t1.cds [Oikopleura dioica]|uniref:Oidioi.mRNA.OKI2018_I69.XSR.g15686.t1.cds n=1 Tax=Oikopleura dioica TaxID=34765 RepID=A0ABN7SE57_OIKDI|nr:Oidioi.mRNA.OKI2018_I69.XSR.g15686.t1.cds [Oikopleura dioica]
MLVSFLILFGLSSESVFDVTWKCPDLERITIPASSVGPNFIRQIKYRCNFNYKCFYNKNLLQEFSEGYCSAKKALRHIADREFLPACQTHDACYRIIFQQENSISAKNNCDQAFYENVLALCNHRGGSDCKLKASLMYRATSAFGDDSFQFDQTIVHCQDNQ